MSETQLELQVISNAQEVVTALDNLEQALRRVQDALGEGLDFGEMSEKLQEFSKGVEKAFPEDVVSRFERFSNSLAAIQLLSRMDFDSSGIASFADEINDIASGLNEIEWGNIVLKTVGSAASNILGNLLGNFFSSGVETIETVWNVTIKLNDQPASGKENGWMIDELLVPALGDTLAGQLKTQIMANGTGSVEIPVTFTINATTGITSTLAESSSGITLDDIRDAAWRSFMSDLDAEDTAFGSGFSLNNALTAGGAVVDTGMTITGQVSVAIQLVPDGGISWADKKSVADDIQEFLDNETFTADVSLNVTGTEVEGLDVDVHVGETPPSYVPKAAERMEDYGRTLTTQHDPFSDTQQGNDDWAKTVEDVNEAFDFLDKALINVAEFIGLDFLADLIRMTNGTSDASEETADFSEALIGSVTTIITLLSALGSLASAATYAADALYSIPVLSGIGGSGGGAAFAEGGFPTTGSMFIAREAGPEFVGTIGNRTAVANNDQIVEGVASGVAVGQSEQNALLRRQNDLLTQLLNKRLTAEVVPSAALGKVNRRSEEMYARNAGV